VQVDAQVVGFDTQLLIEDIFVLDIAEEYDRFFFSCEFDLEKIDGKKYSP
jgi:hypothetical protein